MNCTEFRVPGRSNRNRPAAASHQASVRHQTGRLLAMIALLLFSLPAVTAGVASALDGYWLSDGYGLLVEVEGERLVVSEITRISRIRQAEFRVQRSGDDRWFVADESDPDENNPGDAMFTIRRVADPDERLHVQAPDKASEIIFARADAPPQLSADESPHDPLYNFDVFCQTFSDHYPLFQLKQVDWPAKRERVRSTLSNKSTETELYAALVAMVEPLQDAHVSIEAPSVKGSFLELRRDAYDTDGNVAFVLRAMRAIRVLEKNYFEREIRNYARGNVRIARLPDGVLYLGITSFSDFGEGSFSNQLKQFERDLDEIFTVEMSGLVIDLRLNLGGSDILGQSIAARLTSNPYVAYRKVARNDTEDKSAWTSPQPSTIQPRRPGFAGPVAVLVSRGTISAGETFTQALMGREPEVVRIGQNTQGVFSDVLNRTLPNGWTFGLPNELFLDETGHYYDGAGIAPHFRVPVFDHADLDAGRDPAVDKALEVIATNGQ